MSKPKGKCVFCGEPRKLTHGHVWPEWIGEELGLEAPYHIELLQHVYSEREDQPPSFHRRVRQGHATSRKPRNTCGECNSGWMSKIEGAAKPIGLPLMQGSSLILRPVDQMLLAALFCLITIRNEFNRLQSVAIPGVDRDCLRTTLLPPWHGWKIWIAKYGGPNVKENWSYHQPMHLASGPPSQTGPDKTNTQTTTLVIGQVCAHVFSSTYIPGFDYIGLPMVQIWPPRPYDINWRNARTHTERTLFALMEVIPRAIPRGIPAP